jgi:UDP-N-acetylmuramate dehydrogenase
MPISPFRDHVPLRDVAWFPTGGVAEWFVACPSSDALVQALRHAEQAKLPFRVVGDMSNVLVSDNGFRGLLIQNRADEVVFMHDRSQVLVDAGVSLASLIARSVSLGYSGLEPFIGIPGTVGGAVYGNVTVGRQSIGQYVRSVICYEPGTPQPLQKHDTLWCAFSERTSRLKQWNEYDGISPVIIRVVLQLSKMNREACQEKLRRAHALANRARLPDRCLEIISPPPNATLDFAPKEIKDLTRRRDNGCYITHNQSVYLGCQGTVTSQDALAVMQRVAALIEQHDTAGTFGLECLGLWDEKETVPWRVVS